MTILFTVSTIRSTIRQEHIISDAIILTKRSCRGDSPPHAVGGGQAGATPAYTVSAAEILLLALLYSAQLRQRVIILVWSYF